MELYQVEIELKCVHNYYGEEKIKKFKKKGKRGFIKNLSTIIEFHYLFEKIP